jgi:ElaB/YqjD/DUF883 family membrane-anchored ribosome-binding protein
MTADTIDRMVNKGFSGAEHIKIETAEALEEAAHKLRSADISKQRQDIKHILHDAEARIDEFKEEIGVKYHEMEADYHRRVKPVEIIIGDHPIPAVMLAMGIGFLFGMLICKVRD